MKKYKLYLDDIRDPSACLHYMFGRIGNAASIYGEHWIIVRDYEQFTEYITNHGLPEYVSFDHDLAPEHYTPEEFWESFEKSKKYQDQMVYKEKTGADCAHWLRDYCYNNNLKLPKCLIHSMNPVGSENIKNILNGKSR